MILLTNISELLTPLDPEETFEGLELLKLSLSFGLNFLMVWVICHFLYYPKGHRRDYYFTFILLSVAIFMMIYLMNGSQMEIGIRYFALSHRECAHSRDDLSFLSRCNLRGEWLHGPHGPLGETHGKRNLPRCGMGIRAFCLAK